MRGVRDFLAIFFSLVSLSIITPKAHAQQQVALGTANERLCGRMQGHFATSVVVHIAANGETTMANAGHLAPYLNGEEVVVAGSLPLGMVEAADLELVRFTLQPGDRITLMTDGIVEAQDEKKELFGFARTNELMRPDRSALEIAAVAQAFGQQDDITVLRVVRAATVAGHATAESALAVG